MRKIRIKRLWMCLIIILIIILLAILFISNAFNESEITPPLKKTNVNVKDVITTYYLEESDKILKNPGVGLAPWAKNKATLELDTTLVYIDLSWAQWEPEEGKYDYTNFEVKNHINQYKKQGKKAVFRFYLDYPQNKSHMDIPTWLYDKINNDGTMYDMEYGKGFSPNYANSDLIYYHEKAIQALAQRYGNDDFFLYIELGSIGHWGEWHVNYDEGIQRLPEYEIRMKYIDPYIKNFPQATFLMRYSTSETKVIKSGLYNDMTGSQKETEYWFEQMEGEKNWDQTGKKELVDNTNLWKTHPIGGEFASSHSNSYFLKDNFNTTLSLIKQTHQSFIGPKIIVDEKNFESYSDKMNEILRILGHRLYINKYTLNMKEDKSKFTLTINLTNSGIAPMYNDAQLAIYIYDSQGKLITKNYVNDFDARNILPDENHEVNIPIDVKKLVQKNEYTIAIGFEDKKSGEPIIELAMEEYLYKIYKIGQINW